MFKRFVSHGINLTLTFIIWKWKIILVLENPFSNPCYPREISLYFGALTVVCQPQLL